MAEGVDYSFARPTPSGLKAAGKRFAVRYVGTPTSGKSLDLTEARALRAAGVDVVAVYQTTANFMLSADGAVAARRAHDHAVACGMPASRPIYIALDTDPGGLNSAEWAAVERFCNQAASVLGRNRVGVYAGYAGIERLCPNFARWGWQTYAWSAGRLSTKAQLYQYRNGVALAGGTVDLCRSLASDYGQWGVSAPEEEDQMTPEQMTELKAHIDGRISRAFAWLTTGAGNAWVNPANAESGWSFADDAGTVTLNEIKGTLDNGDRWSLLAAAGANGAAGGDLGDRLDTLDAAVANVTTDAVDVPALAAALAPLLSGLGEDDWEHLRSIVDSELDKRSLAD